MGPGLGGFLSAGFGTRAPFYAALVFSLLNVTLTSFLFKETLKKANKRVFQLKRSNLIGTFRQLHSFQYTSRLMFIFFLFQLAFYTYPAVWAYYTIERLGWDAEMIGLSLTTYGAGVMLVKGFLVRPVIERIGLTQTAIAGLTIHVVSFIAYGMFRETWQVFAYFPVAIWGGLAQPAIAGLISNTVPEDFQGELQGATTSVIAIAAILSPLTMTQIFRYTTAEFSLPEVPFFLAATIALSAIIILVPLAIGVNTKK